MRQSDSANMQNPKESRLDEAIKALCAWATLHGDYESRALVDEVVLAADDRTEYDPAEATD